jgi:hypothetical protein
MHRSRTNFIARNFGQIPIAGCKLCTDTLPSKVKHFLRVNEGVYKFFDAYSKEEGLVQMTLQMRIVL